MWIVARSGNGMLNTDKVTEMQVRDRVNGGAMITCDRNGEAVCLLKDEDKELIHSLFDDIVYSLNLGYTVCYLAKAEREYHENKAKKEAMQ